MTTRVPIPVGSYAMRDPKASVRRLVNCFAEPSPQSSHADSKQDAPPAYMRRAPGITAFTSAQGEFPVRGMHQMGSVVYLVAGTRLYSMDSTGDLAVLGDGIPGSGFVRMVDNTACLVILIPGTNVAFTYTTQTGFNALTEPQFITFGAIDIGFVDTFIVFLALNGLEFYNDDGQVVSGQGPITFTSGGVFPREFATDLLVGMAVDHRQVVVFGERTSEGYLNAGNATNSPFASAPDTFMEIGVHPDAGYAIALQDQALFFVANDRTVRRRNGQTPARVSNSGIEAILEKANLKGCYALTPSIAGHPLWVLTMPAEGRTIVYDTLSTEWFELQSYNLGYWRPSCYYNAFGKQLIGDSQSNAVGFLDTSASAEFSNIQVSTFTTQAIYDGHNRITHRRLEIVITAGEGSSFTQGAQITLFVSDDSGQTWFARETQDLGLPGSYQNRVFWQNLGQSRDRVYRFQISDPSIAFTVDIMAELQGGKW